MTIDDGIEHLVAQVFGPKASYQFTSSEIAVSQWRRLVERLFRSLKQAITENVVNTDRAHVERLLELCDRDMAPETSKDRLNSLTIRTLVELVFELVGGQPDHTAASGRTTRHSWRLDHYRSIGYTHSLAQKALLLQSTTGESRVPHNCREFIEKFRRDHPDKYSACF
ncbi:MAG: hypothetical protein IT450_13200 [Phycisphaerales bacterium]|nr:hypothetical protein [Phycisphaerales bacterium]